MASESERFRKAIEANTKAIEALQKAFVEFHREFRRRTVNPYPVGSLEWINYDKGLIHGHVITKGEPSEQ